MHLSNGNSIMNKNKRLNLSGLTLLIIVSTDATSAISMDRTRIIFDGENKSISINIKNNNSKLPYLAQGWIENDSGKKINSPFTILPPIQRVEPSNSTQIKIETLSDIVNLPQDRESLYYFNLREIPPKSSTPNTMQIALQTRVKLFYRPKNIESKKNNKTWYSNITLAKSGNNAIINNPTPYYITVIKAGNGTSSVKKDYTPVMISPFGNESLGIEFSELGATPKINYIDDFGGKPAISFNCSGNSCLVNSQKNK